MRILILAVALTIVVLPGASCRKVDPLYCNPAEGVFCWDGARPFCDVRGITDEAMGHGRTCVSTDPYDANNQTSDAPPGSHALTVALTGSGTGRVVSSPAGIDCGSACSAAFAQASMVTLTATADPASGFAGWAGACNGAATCSLSMDVDRSVSARFLPHADVAWLAQLGATTYATANAVAATPSGDVVLTGGFDGSMTLATPGAPAILVGSGGGGDIVVVKLSGGDGSPLWAKRFGGTGFDEGRAIGVDGSGDVFVAGTFAGTVTIGGNVFPSAGGDDVLVAKLSGATGEPVWARRFGDTGSDSAYALAVDSAGDVIVGGQTRSTSVSFGGSNLTGPGHVWIGRYGGADGAHRWSRRFGASSDGADFARSIVADGLGNVVFVGTFLPMEPGETLSLGGPTFTSTSGGIFVAKLSGGQGTHVWSKLVEGQAAEGQAVAIDPSNAVVVAGNFQGTTTFGADILTSAGGSDVLLAKYSAAGAPVWGQRYGGPANDRGLAVAALGQDIVVTGDFAGTANLGGPPLSSAGGADGFFGRYRGVDGMPVWARRLGGATGADPAGAGAVSPMGLGVVCGAFKGLADFGSLTATAVAGSLGNGFCLSFVP